MKPKELLLQFIQAQDENELQEIIDKTPFLQSQSNWRTYGGNETNFNQILNQQSNPVQALVEKPINSIDAILLKECRS